jgi:hypothetical protein
MNLREIGWSNVDWTRDQWTVLVNTVMDLWVSQNAGKFSSSSATGSF